MSLNLAECLEVSADTFPDKTAVVLGHLRLSYAELAAATKRVANVLDAKGIGRGDVVAMMIPNTPHFPMIYHGILYTGATVLPMNPTLRRRSIEYQLRDSGAKALFVWQDFAEEAAKAVHAVAACRELVVVEPTLVPSSPEAGDSFVGLLAAAPTGFDMVQTRPEETAVLIYTSALGGRLYGAELSHFNLYDNIFVLSEYVVKYYPDDVFMAALPLFHAFGQSTMMNAVFLRGASVVMAPRFEPHKVLKLIEDERVTVTCLVPTMLHFLQECKKGQTFDLSSLRSITTGGSALPVPLAEAFTERFNVPILQGYGLTETGPVVSFNKIKTNRLGSIGEPIWGCKVRIQLPDGGFAGPNEEGEIVLRGHDIMKGYLNAPEATERVMAGGWFHTGDLGHVDEDGFLYITGRLKDVIIRSGLNVYPVEVEEVLEEHPAVQEAAVVGVPDPVRGEEPKAFVVLKPGAVVTEQELGVFCRQELASYKRPRSFAFVDALPRDNDGAIRKDLLRKGEA